MKHAYVSLILMNQNNDSIFSDIKEIDSFLSKETRKHEIVLVVRDPFLYTSLNSLELKGPLTVVATQSTATTNDQVIAGLGRSVGDFVVEWTLSSSRLTSQTIETLLLPSDAGVELLEVIPANMTLSKKFFYDFVNRLRSSDRAVRPSIARVYSRRALNWILVANRYESNILVLAAELPFKKAVHKLEIERIEERRLKERVLAGFVLLTKGSRFGTVVPLFLAGISSLFAVGVAIYALIVFFMSGDVAEGWTSIAVVMGFGQGAILALIGLVWSRLDSLAKGLSKRNDPTINTEIFPAKL